MRIARLDLSAFGPFTDTKIDLSGGAPGGLHVVYGPNEAGKSSALRAVRDLLYGFEERTPDAHRHRYEDLRIGGLLEGAGGSIYVERWKRRKDSLRDEHGEPLDEARLRRLLGGVDRGTFQRSFGLGHAELAAGGEQMLRGEASVGETLFDAGTGGMGVRRVLDALRTEKERLYRPRAKAEVNLLLDQLAETKRRCQDALLLPETWDEQRAELEAAREEVRALGERAEALRVEQHRVRDLRNALPALLRRADCLSELAALGRVANVPDSARERRERALSRAAEARAAASRLEEQLERARRRLSEIELPEGLLALDAGRIVALGDAVGRTRKARGDLPRREKELAALKAEEDASLRRLGRSEGAAGSGALRVAVVEQARIRQLATERQKLDERARSAEERAAETRRELFECRKRLERLPAVDAGEALARVAALARAQGDADASLAELERQRTELGRRSARRLRELAPFAGSLEELEQLRVPLAESVEHFAGLAAEAAARRSALGQEARGVERRLSELEARAAALRAGGDVPSETALVAARSARDAAGTTLFERWRAQAPFDGDSAGRYRELGIAADAFADRLRREADRVAALAQDEVERAALVAERVRLDEASAELDRASEEQARAFRSASGEVLGPLAPAAMRGWLACREQVLELLERERHLDVQIADLRAARQRLATALAAALGSPPAAGEPLAPLVERCAALEAEQSRLASERRELERSADALEARLDHDTRALASAERGLGAWHAAWADAVCVLGVGPDLLPLGALELLEELGALAERRERIEGLEQRILGIRRDESELAEEVRALQGSLGLTLGASAPDTAAQEIVERYRRAQAARDERLRLDAEIVEREAELDAERQRLGTATRELDELCGAAGVGDPSELPEVEEKSRRSRELGERLLDLEAGLVDQSGGRSVATLVAEAQGVDAPELAARLDAIERELLELEELRGRTIDLVGRLQGGLVRQADATGADAAQDEQALAAALRERIARYARLSVAEALLVRSIERYRLAHQGPILRRASELFPRLTCHAYSGLRLGREERAIVAVRPDGSELAPHELSEGTRYQLYLALRLASVERFAASSEPLPLVLDDAMIHFDDERKGATFAALGELAERLQILFFTHHEGDVELALKAAPGRAFRHELTRHA